MWRRALAAVAIWGVVIASARAAYISTSSVPTVGIPGMTTYTFTATANAGEKIVGFDFVGGTYGIYGPLNQVNPVGLPTVFNDNNALFGFVGADVSQDTQFLVKSTDGIAINRSESANSLRAAFAFLPASLPWGNTLAFAQIVTSSPTQVDYYGTLTIRNQAGEDRLETVCGFFCNLPFAASYEIDNVAAEGPGIANYQVTAYTRASLGNLRFDSYIPAPGGVGSGPANPASLDYGNSSYYFNWNTHGSPLGTY